MKALIIACLCSAGAVAAAQSSGAPSKSVPRAPLDHIETLDELVPKSLAVSARNRAKSLLGETHFYLLVLGETDVDSKGGGTKASTTLPPDLAEDVKASGRTPLKDTFKELFEKVLQPQSSFTVVGSVELLAAAVANSGSHDKDFLLGLVRASVKTTGTPTAAVQVVSHLQLLRCRLPGRGSVAGSPTTSVEAFDLIYEDRATGTAAVVGTDAAGVSGLLTDAYRCALVDSVRGRLALSLCNDARMHETWSRPIASLLGSNGGVAPQPAPSKSETTGG